jgi:predicted DNA-binding antitoxin AbrB/MazE fold protein
MKAVRAIYEHGVFRPREPVDLPEASEVFLTPEIIEALRPMTKEEADEIDGIQRFERRDVGVVDI